MNISPSQRVAAELIRRNWKRGDLAKALGISPKILTNVLCGNKSGKAAWSRIEDVLGLPLVSSPDEFAARQTEAKIKEIFREMSIRAGGQLASMDNISREFQAITAAIGINLIVLVTEAAPDSPFWNASDTNEPFSAELAEARAGTFDSSRMSQGCYLCFYHASKSQFAPTLTVLKKGIEARGLLAHTRLFAIESEDGAWLQYWPATAERF